MRPSAGPPSGGRNDLVDTSGRNRLRRYRDLKTSTLDLTLGQAEGLNAQALNRLLADKPVNLSELFSERTGDPDAPLPFDDARRRLTAIHRTALTNREEKGIETCFAGIGLATWKVEQGTEPKAPVVLLPLEVEASGAAARDFRIEVSGDAHLNPVLTHILRGEHDIDTEDDEADVAEDPPTDLESFRALLARLEDSWSALPELVIEPRIVTAIFSYSTMPLVTDLEENGELFAESDIVAAIAGDQGLAMRSHPSSATPTPTSPISIHPQRSSSCWTPTQASTWPSSRTGRRVTGDSGASRYRQVSDHRQPHHRSHRPRKRVLFVAEKRAAIEAVTKRLEQVGLSDLVMDMHGRITSRRDFARTLADSLGHVATIPSRDYSALHSRLEERRDSLIANDAALHQPRKPWNLCVFHMRERLLAIPEAARTQLRLSTDAARNLDRDGFERLTGEIEEWIDLGGHVLDEDHPEWAHSTITTGEEARETFDLVRDLAHEGLPAAREALSRALDEVGLEQPATVGEWHGTVNFLSSVETTLERCRPDVYELDHTELREGLARARGSLLARTSAQLFSGSYRAARETVGANLRQTADLSAADALVLVEEVAGQVEEWAQRQGGGQPRVPEGLGDARGRVAALREGFNALVKLAASAILIASPKERFRRPSTGWHPAGTLSPTFPASGKSRRDFRRRE